MSRRLYEVAVVGGGIIGLATARELLQRGAQRVAVVEAESALAQHQTGRNSGVVHAGIYYKPGSLKAKLCLEGLRRSYEYFKEKNIPHRKVGKLIVALDERQVPELKRIYQNAMTNGVPGVAYLDNATDMRRIEPECAGVAAIHSPNTGIVDWGLVAEHYGQDVREMGGDIYLNSRVIGLQHDDHVTIHTQGNNATKQTLHAEKVITCTGAQSDRVARMLDGSADPQIIPIRGEYLRVTNEEIARRIRGNIYPVPDSGAGSPFLGVHFTRTMNDEIIVGPNAVIALSRNGYSPFDVRADDMRDMLRYAGFWHLVRSHGLYGAREMYQSLSVRAAATAARAYVPALHARDFARRGARYSGIRAQAVRIDGALVDDFVFESVADGRVLHTRNAPSPGATSSLAISRVIVEKSLEGDYTVNNSAVDVDSASV